MAGGSTVWIITVLVATANPQLVVILLYQACSGLPLLLRVGNIHARNSERGLEGYRGSYLVHQLEILMLFVRNHMDVNTINVLREEVLR